MQPAAVGTRAADSQMGIGNNDTIVEQQDYAEK